MARAEVKAEPDELAWIFDMLTPLIEGGYSEEHLWGLTFSQLKRRLAARRRWLAVQRIERMQEVRIGTNGEAEDVKAFVEVLNPDG